jgi:ABC-2 type transport system ATP-binding protein
MRMVLGLDRPTEGTSSVSGRRYVDFPAPLREVGALLDAGAMHPGRTGRAHLRIGAHSNGIPLDRVDEVIDQVGLGGAAGRRVKGYSLGMRQRLGIANALIGDPSVLILDEPANGLDPAGIHWMRSLLRGYAERGGTVLLSSHLLHEVEKLADEIVLIGRGRIVAQGTKAELLATRGTLVRAETPELLLKSLDATDIAYLSTGDGAVRTEAEPVEVGRAAADAGVVLTELRPAEGAGLEELFLQLTADDAREAVTPEGASA